MPNQTTNHDEMVEQYAADKLIDAKIAYALSFIPRGPAIPLLTPVILYLHYFISTTVLNISAAEISPIKNALFWAWIIGSLVGCPLGVYFYKRQLAAAVKFYLADRQYHALITAPRRGIG